MSKISKIHAREVLDSRGFPTIEVETQLDSGIVTRAIVPSGASTGTHEALELRDGDASRFVGKGVRKAVQNVKEIIAPKLVGRSVSDHAALDHFLLSLDDSENKSQLGANAILGVSLSTLKAAAQDQGQELFRYVGGEGATNLPVPLMNVLNGGAHADNGLDVQEYMIVPVCGGSYSEALRAGSEVFHALKKSLSEKSLATSVGDEGGFAPQLENNEKALDFLSAAVEKAGYKLGEDILFALDVAATEFFESDHYNWQGRKISSAEMTDIYKNWCSKYPIVSIEDGLSEDDWSGWAKLTSEIGDKVQLVGDDLFVTNPKRLGRGLKEKSANAILIKVNQIGSFSETKQTVQMAHEGDFQAVMSHRSGETEDVTIADLAVGLGTSQIKTGSLSRGERTAKYNQLLRIEESLGTKAQFHGAKAFGR